MNYKELEFIWYPSSLGSDVNIFTHVLYDHYRSPVGFDFESNSRDPQWINDKMSKYYNAQTEAAKLLHILDERSAHYLTDDLLVVFGDDFKYS